MTRPVVAKEASRAPLRSTIGTHDVSVCRCAICRVLWREIGSLFWLLYVCRPLPSRAISGERSSRVSMD